MDFEEKDYIFLKKEFGIDKKTVDAMDERELAELIEKCFDIEVEETIIAGDDPLSERGEEAVRLVDLIHGPYDSTEFDEEMADDTDH